MVDLYRIPSDAPGFEEARAIRDPIERARMLELRLREDIADWRFLPYIQVHEFEALLFSEPSAFRNAFPEAAVEIERLDEIADTMPSPEHIDDGFDTSPSKRIASLLSEFAKPVHGPMIVNHIGLATIRRKCFHFDEWYRDLLQWSAAAERDEASAG
jgi:hypothetical protein